MSKKSDRQLVPQVVAHLVVLSGLLMFCFDSVVAQSGAQSPSAQVEILTTKGGIRFGLWRGKNALPAPTLFVFGTTFEQTLGDPYLRQSCNSLAESGYICVSLDLPGHGSEIEPGETAQGLNAWRSRLDRGESVITEYVGKITKVLDYLIAAGYSDPNRIAACGTSRGGFIALHFAAGDPRVRCVAAFAPVINLAVLKEFAGTGGLPQAAGLSPRELAVRLAGRPLWLVIGDRDERVGTDETIAFARAVTAASIEKKLQPRVELHVLPEPRGHATPVGSAERAANWVEAQLQAPVGRN